MSGAREMTGANARRTADVGRCNRFRGMVWAKHQCAPGDDSTGRNTNAPLYLMNPDKDHLSPKANPRPSLVPSGLVFYRLLWASWLLFAAKRISRIVQPYIFADHYATTSRRSRGLTILCNYFHSRIFCIVGLDFVYYYLFIYFDNSSCRISSCRIFLL